VGLAGCAGVTDRMGLGNKAPTKVRPRLQAETGVETGETANTVARHPTGAAARLQLARTAGCLGYAPRLNSAAEASKPAASGAKSFGYDRASLGSATNGAVG